MTDLSSILPTSEIRYNEPMRLHTSFKIGGPVRAMVFPKNANELSDTVCALRSAGIEPFVLGNGTNLLVAEKPLELVVVKTPQSDGGLEMISETEISAYSGVSLSRLASFAAGRSLTGLEFAHGIPGSVGGAVFMNAGAYGGEVGELITSVNALLPVGEFKRFTRDECVFSYRHSIFSGNGAVILDAVFELKRGDKTEINAKMRELAAERREKQPLDLPSAGSAFKRPANGYAAKMIDECGLRGFRIGGAAVSDKHAGFIVNLGSASFDDVLRVIDHVKNEVQKRFDIQLMPEIRIID